MERDHHKELEKIIGDLQCPRDFKCYKSGFKALCKARDVGLETFIQCLEEDPSNCPFTMRLHGMDYCRCPVRVYLVKELKK
jgi:hypothetical protein